MSVFNDARFRGYSISDGDPVAIVDLSYDDPDGFYAAASGTAVARSGGVHPLQLQLNGGYARRLKSGLTLDAGVIQSNYSHYSSTGPGKSYTEVYAGVAGKSVASRVYVSPDYFRSGQWTLYGELEGNVTALGKLRLEGHVGVLTRLRHGGYGDYHPTVDWRLGVARSVGRVTLHAAWIGRGSGRDMYEQREYGRNAVVVGLSYVL